MGFLGVGVCYEFDGKHGAAAADFADDVEFVDEGAELFAGDVFDAGGAGVEVPLFHGFDGGKCCGAGDGVAAVGAAEAAGLDLVEEFGAAGDGGEGHTAGDALGGGDEVGFDAFVVGGEPAAGAAEACLDFVRDEDDALFAGPGDQLRQEAFGGDDEATFALDGFDKDCGDVFGANLLFDHVNDLGGGFLATQIAIAVGVAHGGAVDLGGEGAEALLVGGGLGGEGHGEVGAAVVGVVEDDDGVAAGGCAGDFDGVFYGFGAGVEEYGALVEVAGSELVEFFGDGYVAFVGCDHEAGVGEVGGCFTYGVYDFGGGGADGGDGDAGAEVGEGVAVDIDDDAAVGVRCVDGQGGGYAGGDVGGAAGCEFG